jgi:predicted dehydrogenase
MSPSLKTFDVTVVGGGMIVNDQLLPSLFQLQREGVLNDIHVVDQSSRSLRALAESPDMARNFPGQQFIPHPDLEEPPENTNPDLFREVISQMEPHNAVLVALPDHLHYMGVKEALEHDQNVLSVKPLVLKYDQTVEIEQLAYEKGLFVAAEYHKRFDRRSLIARRRYGSGQFGEFIYGEAHLFEPYYYRHSNFQNWFLVDNTDPFVYIGCHYVDLVWFITGLKPVRVSVTGVRGTFPNGNEGYLWSNGRVVYENGAILTVSNGLGYPNDGAGSNEQGLMMFFEGTDKTGYLKHNDQFRGVECSFLEGIGPSGQQFNYVNPDYLQFVPWEGDGFKPVGYGFDSVAASMHAIRRLVSETADLDEEAALPRRQEILKAIDAKGLLATPASAYINELVTEAARLSIQNNGTFAEITYDPRPAVFLGPA